MHRSTAVILGGLIAEAGCLWIWHEAARLTAIYNADYTGALFTAAPWLAPLVDHSAPPDPGESVARLMVGLALMAAGYLIAIAAARKGTTAWVVVGFAAVFRVTLAVLPGLFSTDVFSYVMYGRIAAVYGQNPYVLPPSVFPTDPLLAWVFPFWRDQPSVYGPLWTDLSLALSAVTANWSLLGQAAAYRAAVIGWEAVSLVALWALLGGLEAHARPRQWLLYAWNPLVVFDLVGASHNDAAMLALLLLGVLCIDRLRGPRGVGVLAGFGLLALSALVKFATALVVVIGAVAWAASVQGAGSRAVRLVVGFGVPAVVAGVLWWPWLASSPDALTPIRDAFSGRLVLNSAVSVVGQAAGQQELAAWLARAVFGAWCACELVRVWRSPREAFGASARLLLGLPLLVLSWVWSWYFSWPLAMAILPGVSSRLTRLVVAYTLVALPVVYAHQYLNEQLPGGWVMLMALGPLIVLLPIRLPPATRTLIKTGGTQPMNLRTVPASWGLAIVRLMAGIIIFWASVEKFQAGGPANFAQSPSLAAFPMPAFWGTFIPLLEGIGGALLILGLGARWAAVLLTIEYFGTGLWIKTHSAPPFGGWDSMRIDLMLMATAFAIVVAGPGAFALENVLLRRRARGRPESFVGRPVPG